MTTPVTTAAEPLDRPQRDVSGVVLAVLGWLWIHLTTLLAHAVAWFVEQTMSILGGSWPRWVSPVVSLCHVARLLVPLLPLALLWRRRRCRALFRAWAAAVLYAACLIPARLARPNQEHLAALLAP